MGRMLTIDEVAERYQVDRGTLWRWRRDGLFLQPIQTPDGLRWDSDRLDVWDRANESVKELLSLDDAEWRALVEHKNDDWTGDLEMIRELLIDFFGLPPDVSDKVLRGRVAAMLDKLSGVFKLTQRKKDDKAKK